MKVVSAIKPLAPEGAPEAQIRSLKDLHREIDKVASERCVSGWDGHGGAPIETAKEAHEAADFIQKLQPGVISPPLEVIPCPDGTLDFEWYFDAANHINISVMSGPGPRVIILATRGGNDQASRDGRLDEPSSLTKNHMLQQLAWANRNFLREGHA